MILWIIKTSCLCYLPQPSASADNTDLGFDNSWYHAKTELNNCLLTERFYLEQYMWNDKKQEKTILKLLLGFSELVYVNPLFVILFSVTLFIR